MRPGIQVDPQGFGRSHLLEGRSPSFHSFSGFSVPCTLVPNGLLIRSCYKHRSPLWIGVVALGPVLATVAGHHGLYLSHGLSAVTAVHPDFPGRPEVVQLLFLFLFFGKLQLFTVKSINQQVLQLPMLFTGESGNLFRLWDVLHLAPGLHQAERHL